MNIEEKVYCTPDNDHYRDFNTLMTQAFLAGKEISEKEDESKASFDKAIQSLHGEIRDLSQDAFDAGRRYEGQHNK